MAFCRSLPYLPCVSLSLFFLSLLHHICSQFYTLFYHALFPQYKHLSFVLCNSSLFYSLPF